MAEQTKNNYDREDDLIDTALGCFKSKKVREIRKEYEEEKKKFEKAQEEAKEAFESAWQKILAAAYDEAMTSTKKEIRKKMNKYMEEEKESKENNKDKEADAANNSDGEGSSVVSVAPIRSIQSSPAVVIRYAERRSTLKATARRPVLSPSPTYIRRAPKRWSRTSSRSRSGSD